MFFYHVVNFFFTPLPLKVNEAEKNNVSLWWTVDGIELLGTAELTWLY